MNQIYDMTRYNYELKMKCKYLFNNCDTLKNS